MAAPSKLRGQLQGPFVGALVAAVLIALTYRLVPASRWIDNGKETTTFDYALLPTFYICLIIREIGHVIAGWLMGMKFCRVQVWPLRILRGPRGGSVGRRSRHFPLGSGPGDAADHIPSVHAQDGSGSGPGRIGDRA